MSNEQEREMLGKPDAPGVKFDHGKLRYELLPPEFLLGLAEVTTFGASKYNDRNWEKGIDEERLLGAMFRHVELHRQGDHRTGPLRFRSG